MTTIRAPIDPISPRAPVALATLGAAQALVYLLLSAWNGYRERPILAVALALTAFALYLLSVYSLRRLPDSSLTLAIAVGFGLLFRVTLIGEPPFLSDDYYRYLWDGLVATHGINPYRYAPIAAQLAGLDEALRSSVNHPAVPTIYPPLAQLVFHAVAVAGLGPLGLKAAWLACDVAIAALLYRLVPASDRLASWTIYWWSPLVIVEVAWNAHLDLLGALPLIVALWAARSARPRSVALGIAVAAATLVKYFAAVILPAAARVGRPVRVAAAFAVTAVALYLPYADAGTGLFQGLATFAARWRFNDSLHGLLAWMLSSPGAAKAVAAGIVLLLVVQAVRNEWPLERAAFWLVGAVLMLSPTVHPWYLLWMVPLVAIRFNRAWLYLSGSVMLAYYGLGAYLDEGVWPQPWPIRLLIYAPFYLLLVLDAWRGSWWQAAWEVGVGGREWGVGSGE